MEEKPTEEGKVAEEARNPVSEEEQHSQEAAPRKEQAAAVRAAVRTAAASIAREAAAEATYTAGVAAEAASAAATARAEAERVQEVAMREAVQAVAASKAREAADGVAATAAAAAEAAAEREAIRAVAASKSRGAADAALVTAAAAAEGAKAAADAAVAAAEAAAAAAAKADALEQPTADRGGSTQTARPSNVDEAAEVPDHYACPITGEIMTDPVSTVDGFTYEHKAISEWLRSHDTSPATGAKLESNSLIPNRSLRNAIRSFAEARTGAPQPRAV